MATISYLIQAINRASATFNDVADSAAKMGAIVDRTQRSVDALNATLAQQNLAAQAASAGLEKVARSAYGAAAAQAAYTDAVKASTAATLAGGAAATVAAGRYLGLFGLLGGLRGGKIPLFGGGLPGILASVGAVHLLIDGVVEFAAVLIPAAIALTAFGALAGPIFLDIYNNLLNVQKVVTATGQQIYPFTNQLANLQNAVKPEAYRLFGDALVVAGDKTKALGLLAISTGKVLDNFGNRIAAAVTSSGMDIFLKNAVTDVKGLGDVLGNVFGIFGNLLRSVPGYAAVILNAFKGVTGFLETVTGSGITQGAIKAGLAFHGAAIYVGLLGTAVGFLVSKGLTLASRGLLSGALAASRLGSAGVVASDAMLGLGASVEGAAALPWTWIALGATAVGFLIFKLLTAKDAAQSFIATLNTKLAAAPAAQGLQAISQAMASVNAQMAALGAAPVGRGRAGQLTGPGQAYQTDSGAYRAEIVNLKGQATDYNQVLGRLAKTYGSLQVAQLLVSQSGLTFGQITSKNASQEAQNAVAYQAVADQLKAAGALTNSNVIVFGRLNGVASEQVTTISQLNGAWDSYISAVTGSQTTFDTYGQGLATLNAAQKTATLNLGKFKDTIKTAGGAMDGTSQASIALNQAFTTQVTQTGAMIDAWRTAGITGNLLATGVKNAIAPMLKFGTGSREATAQLIALASEAGFQGPETLKALTGWLGITHDSLQKVKNVSNLATIQEALLTSAMQGQAGVLSGQLIGDLNTAILRYSGVYTAVTAYGKALATQGAQSQAARTARQNLITDLINAGKAAHDTTGQIAAMIAKVLKIPLHRALRIVVDAQGSWHVAGYGAPATTGGHGPGHPLGIPSAMGRLVRGGVAGTDSVPILAMPGELVVPTHLVNSGAVDHLRGMIPGYAGGGVVGSYSGSPSGAGTFAQTQYGRTLNAVASATAASAQATMALATAFGGSPYGASSGGVNAALARRMMPAWGQGTEWNAWNYVGMRESGWNAYAVNPSSGAAGIAQRIQGWGPGYQAGNAGQQIAWMIRYIESRYGDPIAAAAHERGFSWYGSGGLITEPVIGVGRSGRRYGFGESGTEAVVPLSGAGGGSRAEQLLARAVALLDELCDIAADSPGAPSSGVPLAGAGGRLGGYKQMFNTRG